MNEKRIREIVAELSSSMGIELCEVRYSPRKGKINVVCDKPGGIGVDECAELNRKLITRLQGEDFLKVKITVSSPGLNRSIGTIDEFRRKILYNVLIEKKNGVKIEGKIVRVEGKDIFLEAPLEERVSFEEVEKARVLI